MIAPSAIALTSSKDNTAASMSGSMMFVLEAFGLQRVGYAVVLLNL